MKRQYPKQTRGSALAYVIVAIVAITALISLGVDVSHVRLVKIQLQDAADSAARAGARALGTGMTGVQNAVVTAAFADQADGSSVAVDPNSDIDLGIWSNGTFTVLTGSAVSSANAVRVRCSHTAARGDPVVSYFGSLIGINSSDVTVQSTAEGNQMPYAGFIGYSGIAAKNNAFFGAYNSAVTQSPTESSSGTDVRVGSNAFISGKNGDTLDGDAVLGPNATVSGFAVQGSSVYPGFPIPLPIMPAWNQTTNPGSIPQDYTVSTDTVLPGGTYWFTSLTANANLTFSGPATVYVNGNITVGGTLAPTSGIPNDLVIYQYGNNTFGDGTSNGLTLTARVIAPQATLTAKNNLTFDGSGIFDTIDLTVIKNNALLFYDQAQGAADGSYAVTTVN